MSKRNINKHSRRGIQFEDYLKKQLKNPKFLQEWNKPTGDLYLDTAFEIIKNRVRKGLSQKDLAKKVRTSQQAIARLENPHYRGYSVKTLEKVANALDTNLEISFISSMSRNYSLPKMQLISTNGYDLYVGYESNKDESDTITTQAINPIGVTVFQGMKGISYTTQGL